MIGSTVSHYRIVAKLGGGGMGIVYRAEDTRLGRPVALKFLPDDVARNRSSLERFQREARAASALNHPNICTIHDIDEADGRPFIVMELMQGETLRERIGGRALAIDEVLRIGMQVAEALDAAHAQGIVHRDIKPENLFITSRGQPKILDFGLAKLSSDSAPTTGADAASGLPTAVGDGGLTGPGVAVGTVAYMSPEQVRGESLDGRSDLFSFGVVLYEMATGRQAFSGATSGVVFDAILNRNAVPALRLNPDIPAGLEAVIARALEKDRGLRYQHASDLGADLARLKRDSDSGRASVENAAVPSGAAATYRSGGAVQTSSDATIAIGLAARHKKGLLAMLAAIVAIAAGGVWWFFSGASSVPAGGAIDSVAALPFTNVSGDPETEYLSDGLTESLINRLARLPDLRVASRSSAFRYKGRDIDPQEAGRALNVRAVITGRVAQRGDNLVIGAELVDLATDSQLWGEQYNRKMSDIFTVQEEIARAIVDKLQVRLTGEQDVALGQRATDDTEAYRLYLKGRFHWNKRTDEGVRAGLSFFEQAIDKDPSYALAHAGVADSYAVGGGSYLGLTSQEARPRGRAAALRAIALDDSLAEAHTTLADILFYHDRDYEGAEREFIRAIKLNPNYATAPQWYSELLSALGRHEEAIVASRRGQMIDPLSPIITLSVGSAYFAAGRLDEALQQVDKAVELDPNFAQAYVYYRDVHESAGRYDEAITAWKRALTLSGDVDSATLVETTYRDGGYEAVLRKSAEIDDRETPRDLGRLAVMYTRLGEYDLAIARLQEALEVNDGSIAWINAVKAFEPLHSDPRFRKLVEQAGLAD